MIVSPQRVWTPTNYVFNGGALLMDASTAHFIYLAPVNFPVVFKQVFVKMTVNGVGTQTAELGLFSSPSPPNKAAQTLTCLTASGTISGMTSGAVALITNTSAFTVPVGAGTYLWAGYRGNMGTTQPTFQTGSRSAGDGEWLRLTSSGALATGTTYAATVVNDTNTYTNPRNVLMFASLD